MSIVALPVNAQSPTPPQSHPKVSWLVRCQLPDMAEHDQLRDRARQHVIDKGKNVGSFERGIEACPKRDIVYFRRVLRKWN